MGQFTIQIKLGNEAMQTPDDIAGALEETAQKLVRRQSQYDPATADEGPIIDLNGNTVGVWRVTA